MLLRIIFQAHSILNRQSMRDDTRRCLDSYIRECAAHPAMQTMYSAVPAEIRSNNDTQPACPHLNLHIVCAFAQHMYMHVYMHVFNVAVCRHTYRCVYIYRDIQAFVLWHYVCLTHIFVYTCV